MKFAIFFCLVAFACVAQAKQAVDSDTDIQVRGVAKDLKEKLIQTRDAIIKLLDKAGDKLKERLEKARRTADKLIDYLNGKAKNATDKIYKAMEKILNTFDLISNDIKSYEGDADLSTCNQMIESAQQSAAVIYGSILECFTDKISRGETLINEVLNRAQEGLNAVLQIKTQAVECAEDVDGVISAFKAGGCMAVATTKATWTATTKVPGIMIDLTKIGALVGTLAPSLSFCVSKNSIVTFYQQSKIVVENVKQCVLEKFEEVNDEFGKVPDSWDHNGDLSSEEIDEIYDEILNEDYDVNDFTTKATPATEATKATEATEITEVDEVTESNKLNEIDEAVAASEDIQ